MSVKKVNREQSEGRRLALQVLFQADVQGPEFLIEQLPRFIAEQTSDVEIRRVATRYANGTWDYRDTADQWICRLVPKWSLSRMAPVDRNVMRMALWELTHVPETPPKVVLDEAINIAREFSTQDSASFVNGVLDAALKEHLAIIAPATSGG